MASNVESMMYVGEVPWHGVGTPLDRAATADEALQAAGLNWTVRKEPLFYNGHRVPRKFVLVRDSDQFPMGIVGRYYSPVQNRDAFRFFDSVTRDPRGPKYVTAGALDHGRTIWILAKLPDCIQITDNDLIDQYLLFYNSHTGEGSWGMFWTPVRVVCQNTLTTAFGKARRHVRFVHIGESLDPRKIQHAQDVLGIAEENARLLTEMADAMLKHKPTDEEIESVLNSLIPDTRVRASKEREKVLSYVHAGKGIDQPGVRGTLWALYNGLVEYADHGRSIRTSQVNPTVAEARFNSLLLGSAAHLKAKALDACLALLKN